MYGRKSLGSGIFTSFGATAILTLLMIPYGSPPAQAIPVSVSAPEVWLDNPQNLFYQFTVTTTVPHTDNDAVGGIWEVGLELDDVKFKDWNLNDNKYDLFFKDVCVPWIAMQWTGGPYTIFQHSDTQAIGRLKYVPKSFSFGETIDNSGMVAYCSAKYYLDFDSDGNTEFTFLYRYEFRYDVPGTQGAIYATIQVLSYPIDGFGGTPENPKPYTHTFKDGSSRIVGPIDFAWRIDASVYNQGSNRLKAYRQNDGWCHFGWETQKEEAELTQDGTHLLKFTRDESQRQVFIQQPGDGNDKLWYSPLRYNVGEYSCWPNDYNDRQDIDNKDVVLWQITRYNTPSMLGHRIPDTGVVLDMDGLQA